MPKRRTRKRGGKRVRARLRTKKQKEMRDLRADARMRRLQRVAKNMDSIDHLPVLPTPGGDLGIGMLQGIRVGRAPGGEVTAIFIPEDWDGEMEDLHRSLKIQGAFDVK